MTDDQDYYAEQDALREEAEAKRQAEEQMQMLGSMLQRKADDAVAKRADTEVRWLEDLRQYNGQYDADVLSRIKANRGSELFINLTRPTANMLEARLADMLFPTDDKNWGIEPTPNPELAAAVNSPADKVVNINGQPVAESALAGQVIEEAKKRCEAMQREIDDQLSESMYNGVAREVIHDSVVLGTGIIKGPVLTGRERRVWQKITDEAGQSAQVLKIEEDTEPGVERVDPWSFFPDPNALDIRDAEYTLERHLLTKTRLRKLAKLPGFMPDQIREVLRGKDSSAPNYLAQIREIGGNTAAQIEGKFEVWEYHGPVDTDVLRSCGCDVGEEDPLEEQSAIVWFCEGRVIKASMDPLESNETKYSVFQWDRDDSSIWGFGVPRLMRNSQRTVNASARMAMDNGGLAVGPQILLDQEIVQPADGNWTLSPRKIWLKTDPTVDARAAFAVFQVDSRLTELMAVIDKAMEWAKLETNLPFNMAADQATPMNETYRGTALLMNSANAVTRRGVKWWDDEVTRPLITRFYDWNMQFNESEDIKGDYRVVARGSSALLVKEIQQQALMQLGQFVGSPLFAPITKTPEWYREVFRSMQLDPDQYVLTDEEIEKKTKEAAQQPPQLPPEIQVKMKALEMEHAHWQAEMQMKAQQGQQPDPVAQRKMQLDEAKLQRELQNDQMDYESTMAQIQRDMQRMLNERELSQAEIQLELAKMANERQVSIEKLNSMLGIERMKIDATNQRFNAEVALKARMGQGI